MKTDKFHEKLKDNFYIEDASGLIEILNSRTLSTLQVDFLVNYIISIGEYQFIRMLIDNRFISLKDEHYCKILKLAIQTHNGDNYKGFTYSSVFSCIMRVRDISKLIDLYGSLSAKDQASSFGVYVFQRFYSKKKNYE